MKQTTFFFALKFFPLEKIPNRFSYLKQLVFFRRADLEKIFQQFYIVSNKKKNFYLTKIVSR